MHYWNMKGAELINFILFLYWDMGCDKLLYVQESQERYISVRILRSIFDETSIA